MMAFEGSASEFIWLLMVLAALIWALIIEQFCFMRWGARSALHALKVEQTDSDQVCDIDWRVGKRLMLVADLNRTSVLLPTLIQIAPVIGLLGTVTAIIEIFRAFSLGKISVLALLPALSEACLTTLMGMLIAVSTWVFLSFLNRERERFYSEMTLC